ncbi:hypothetical protein [Ornithinimicrobium cryptoxanthini]|uniref:Secreted protein n=1 Tax=Ornithinimicrobium cryptoxanthini TaxID=2934161 RepID=A0ABY4YK40_9MICO|nr:hypothetical protein [Ornithinimicrobium cryptoxanthini]USQ76698.1 hypothetical protein NF557_01835 [Ornithinimicrobium cryptoxanthini]
MLPTQRLRPVLGLTLLGVLVACSSAPETADSPGVSDGESSTQDDSPDELATAEPDTAESGTAGSSAADQSGDTAPAGPQEITAQLQADGSVLVEGSQASFLMPSGNVACVIRPDSVVCQIDGKQYAAKQGDINPETFEGCTPETADAMSVGEGTDPTWVCLPYDIRSAADVTAGGAWAGPGLGATDEFGDQTVAVLPYGTTLRLGDISCLSDRAGVDCTDLTTGRGFQLAREGYQSH